jgi:integrase
VTAIVLPIGNVLHDVYTNSQSKDAVTERIKNFTPMMPKRLWNDAVAEFTRSAVTDFAPNTEAEAGSCLTAVARLASWTSEVTCNALERTIVFDGRQIDGFVSRGLPGLYPSTARMMRLRLLRIAAELENYDPMRRSAGRRAHFPAYAPYSSAEILRFRSQGATRSTALRRHNWMTLLALGRGCGLSVSEVIDLRIDDVHAGSDALRIRVRGDRPRTVICLAAWEPDLHQLLASPILEAHLFVKDFRPNNPAHYVTVFLANASKGAEKFKVERLRSTWLVEHLAGGTEPFALMAAAGVKSFSTFERLADYIPLPSDDRLTASFRRDFRDV